QKQVPIGCTMVPILLASDQTHLTNFSGDKKLWPLYMSIGNIKFTICNKPTMNVWIPIALLPIPPKHLDRILGHPVEAQELDAPQMVCCDKKVCNCVPKLSGWLADYMENVMIHGILSNRCPVCIAPPNEFRDLLDTLYDTR
ncbi:hypothetical protein BGX38DRAFT_1096931, partial [Terfezia claveryi]